MKEDIDHLVFWQAAVISIVVFLLGLFVGIMFESQRTEMTTLLIDELTSEFSNMKQMTLYYQQMNDENYCKAAIEQNIKFAEDSLEKGKKIAAYERTNIFMKTLDSKKKEYLSLKVDFLINTLILKEKCNMSQDIIIYLYSDKTTDKNIIAQQDVQSKILMDLKDKQKDSLLLIPLATDLNNSIVDLLITSHNITKMPSLIINNEVVLSGLQSESEIEKYLQHQNISE